MNQIYLIVSRRYDGYMAEKVKLFCSLEEAKNVGCMMLHTKAIKYEIYENGKDYIGDFRVKPIYSYIESKQSEYDNKNIVQ